MFDPLRRAFARLGNFTTAMFAVTLWEVGSRVGLLGVKVDVLADLVNGGNSGLLWLYGLFTGGALTRGAMLALGIVPYFSASVFMRLARIVNPALETEWNARTGRQRVREWTRRLTLGLATIQAAGLSQFLQNNGAAPEGFGFVVRTVLILTAGSVLAMLITEQLSKPSDTDLTDEESEADAADTFAPEALSAGPAAEIIRGKAVHEPVLRTRE